MERVRCAKAATAAAGYFAAKGQRVLLLIDSLTRYAMALREVGLALGEMPATKGYPPSVFSNMPLLLEPVAALNSGGSVTGFYTVLVEGDDLSDPIADSARSLLDGHIVLSRELAMRGQFPAVDVLASTSRVATDVTEKRTQKLALSTRDWLARRSIAIDLLSLGAIDPEDAEHGAAIKAGKSIDEWIRQGPQEAETYEDTLRKLTQAIGEENK